MIFAMPIKDSVLIILNRIHEIFIYLYKQNDQVIFNSWVFLLGFLPAVFVLYWVVFKHHRNSQNILLLIASYVFYGYWDYRFLSLILLSSLVDYFCGRLIERSKDQSSRKLYLWISIITNLGILGAFKYFSFFLNSAYQLLESWGIHFSPAIVGFALPIGISFYTFQTLGYTLDVYKGKVCAERNMLTFFTFVSFFPQLVAGPIERAKDLMPQFHSDRKFSYEQGRSACQLILWGLFLKVVMADSCGEQVDIVYANFNQLSSPQIMLGQIYFTFQLYGDFAGYSLIALGVARLFGFQLSRNFNYPYFSTSVPEFWRRWHMTLGRWFNDYVFFPLARRSSNNGLLILASYALTLGLIGLWHGANWTYIVSIGGTFIYFIPRVYYKRRSASNTAKEPRRFSAMLLLFFLVNVHFVFFRSPSIGSAGEFIYHLVVNGSWGWPLVAKHDQIFPLILIIIVVIIEWNNRMRLNPIAMTTKPLLFRWIVYLSLTLVVLHHIDKPSPYIYFQF